uniref:Uncharacterized protein n=1 Tax=Anguilla anguilla TaxID=7936 RepID=A0A0E9S4J8_ANGAN
MQTKMVYSQRYKFSLYETNKLLQKSLLTITQGLQQQRN